MRSIVDTAFMSVDRTRRSRPGLTLAQARAGIDSDVSAAVEIGNRSSATLGLLPIAEYRAAAGRGNLLLARLDDEVVGYALYALARNRVRLTHLCVDRRFRGLGIARQLVEQISASHADQLGIHVRCRHDYGLGEMWIELGFSQMSEKPGRSKAGHILVNWWRDHGHPTLFTRLSEDVLVRAAVDLNVLRDLADPDRTDTRDARSLIDDQITDRLELVRTGALDAEINSIEGALRSRCTAQAQRMTQVRADRTRTAEVRSELNAAARAKAANYPRSAQDEFDLRHVTDAVAADLNLFITRDEELARLFRDVAEQQFSLRIMHPSDVVIHLDELVRAEAYRPAALLDTAFRRQLLGLGHDADLQRMANTRSGERPRDFQRLLRDLALAHRERTGLFGPDNMLVATFSAYRDGAELVVPLARVADHPLGDTLARQLLFLLRQEARQAGAVVIRLADAHATAPIRLAALNDGFRVLGDNLHAYALDVCDTAGQVSHRAVLAARDVGLPEPPQLRSGMPAAAAAEVERTWWPVKITDSDIPTYLVPIQQVFSADLLGVPQTMFPRQDALGLSREHVYYRSPGGITPQAPARLLWYMSGTGRDAPHAAAVIACSQLDAVVVGTPAELHSRFRHLGVWDYKQVEQAARDNLVQALVFTNTEIFAEPVRRGRLRELAETRGGHRVPYQPLRISNELFAAIYQESRATL
ncbi:GNAT family N-acetyltransferase [Micromonospora orduensis]|uniref:GNAT family N-acetyltransferase n=1 Tax=Micromonospora orduensis TaxID=1420891 RepID=UPI0034018223